MKISLLVIIALLGISGASKQRPEFKLPSPSPLKVSADHRNLVTSTGEPFFWLGDTGWNLFIRLDREEATRYLENRKQNKFTVIQANLLGWQIDEKNAYGERAFINNDFRSPNETYWKHVDFILQTAADKGLYMAVLPAWASSYIEKRKTATDTADFLLTSDTTTAYQYAKFAGNRLKKFSNIIWILGGDVWGRQTAIYDIMAKGLTETYGENDRDKILISFHPQGGTGRPPATSTSEFYHTKPWLDFNMIQSGHRKGNRNYQRIEKDYLTLPEKPTLESEPCYEQHPVEHQFAKGVFTAWDLRQRAYWALFAGSFGFTYGGNGIWQMDKPGRIEKQTHHNFFWYDALDFEGGKQMKYVRALMESRPSRNPERVPDQSLIVSANDSGLAHIQSARSSDLSYIFVYSTNGSAFTLDLQKFKSKKIGFSWYNPRDGKSYNDGNEAITKAAIINNDAQQRTFNPPGEPGENNDWILVLDDPSRKYPIL